MTSPVKFLKEVKQEGSRVTWPTRPETTTATMVVIAMVIVASIFFLVVDWVLFKGVQAILGF
jgi:preprotein translocase subunit SecE